MVHDSLSLFGKICLNAIAYDLSGTLFNAYSHEQVYCSCGNSQVFCFVYAYLCISGCINMTIKQWKIPLTRVMLVIIGADTNLGLTPGIR